MTDKTDGEYQSQKALGNRFPGIVLGLEGEGAPQNAFIGQRNKGKISRITHLIKSHLLCVWNRLLSLLASLERFYRLHRGQNKKNLNFSETSRLALLPRHQSSN
jgi:hypothetical protein